MNDMPYWVMKMGCKSEMKKMCRSAYFTEGFQEAGALYYATMVQRLGKQDVVCQKTLMYFCFLHRTLFTKERMLQDFDFPIAFVNGTRDFFGSAEGSDTIVKKNKHFETGQSQIFKLNNSGHNVYLDNPD